MAEMRKALFSIYILDDVHIEGWTDGSLWNGWATPVFEFAEAKKLLDALVDAYKQLGTSDRAWYDERNDSFCFVQEDCPEPECYPSEIIKVSGQELKVYPIGAEVWVWEEVSAQDDL
jgi:hypothetical protein